MDQLYTLQADVLKTLASPKRLEIIHLLADGPRDVTRLAEELGISQPNVSQHLAVMRAAGVVERERDGRGVSYRLADPDIIVACSLMRGVLARRLTRLAGLSSASDQEAARVGRPPSRDRAIGPDPAAEPVAAEVAGPARPAVHARV